MSAEGKRNTVHLHVRDRIMVRELSRDDETIIAEASPTKVKGAIAMTVYAVPTWHKYTEGASRRVRGGYRIDGVTDDGWKVQIPHASGNQTFWLAKA